ncbi:MAG: TerD family protein [Deltaproteobacteria bacterium]|jgi:stress response protein SCP2|nr:TerD family protein [Deltaproteobacteria bacterium]
MIKGQRVKVSEITSEPVFDVGITMHLSGPGDIGAVCFCLDGAGALAEGRWLVFEGNRSSPGGAVRFMGASRDDGHDFEVTLGKVPDGVAKIVFVAFVSGPGAMNQLTYGHLRIKSADSELSRYVLSGHDFGQEKAVMLAEIYRKSGEWRLYLNGQGFAEGIEGVFRHFRAESLWEALALRESRSQEGGEIVLTPEQAREILEVLRRSAPQDDDPWPSQEEGGDEDALPVEQEGHRPARPVGKPPTIH